MLVRKDKKSSGGYITESMYLNPLSCPRTLKNAETVKFYVMDFLHNKNKKIIKMTEGSIYRGTVNQDPYIVIRERLLPSNKVFCGFFFF